MEPMTVAALMGGAGSLLGGLGGKNQARGMNKPSMSWMQPNSQLGGWGPIQSGFGFAQNVMTNPPDLSGILKNLYGNLGGGLGGGGGGVGTGGEAWDLAMQSARKGAGGGSLMGHPLGQLLMGQLGGGGPGGGDWRGALKEIQKSSVRDTPQTEWEKWVTSQGFQDVANNPLLKSQREAISQEFREEMEQSLSESFAPFAQGGTMGMTGANVMERMRLADMYGEDLANALTQGDVAFRAQNLGAGVAADQAHSARIGQGIQAGGQMFGASAAAAASKYGSLTRALSGMYGADVASAASRYATLMGLQGQLAGIEMQGKIASAQNRMQGAALRSQNAFNLFDREFDVANNPLAYASSWITQMNPAYQSWATQYQKGPHVSQTGAGMTGGLGGLLMGLGLYNQNPNLFGGMGSKGGLAPGQLNPGGYTPYLDTS